MFIVSRTCAKDHPLGNWARRPSDIHTCKHAKCTIARNCHKLIAPVNFFLSPQHIFSGHQIPGRNPPFRPFLSFDRHHRGAACILKRMTVVLPCRVGAALRDLRAEFSCNIHEFHDFDFFVIFLWFLHMRGRLAPQKKKAHPPRHSSRIQPKVPKTPDLVSVPKVHGGHVF